MKRAKILRAAALGVVGALTLTACGGAGGVGNSNKVVFWDTSGPSEHPVFEKLARDCARQGGYQVEVETVAFDQALNNFKTAAQGGQGPDVLRAEVAWVAQLANNGLIKDLSETRLAKNTSDFLDVALASTKFEGKTYAVPQVTDTLALYYNKRKLAEAGVQPPETWEELKEIAPKLGGRNAFFLNNDGYYALPFVYSTGGSLVDAESKTITVNSRQSVQGVRIAKDLLDAGAAQTALDRKNSYNNMKTAFTSGRVAMVIDGPWAAAGFLESEAFSDPNNLGIAPVPGPTTAEGNSPVGGHNYVIRQGTDADEASTKFIECMSSAQSQATIAAELGLLPTRESVYDSPEVAANPIVSAFAPILETAHERAWIPAGDALFDPLNTGYAQLLAGQKTAQEAMDQVAKTYSDVVVPDYTKK
ncbi:extracellular solute-binding protein [Haloactinomyces albus]|uniref:Arabinogalactan oligomer/maltooligosaccharide transport system substrate-binding protein n=1 Tax=Haloactinomyces albus TaxID=1352928 RepID=A0AAE3ZH50_9ACTN|nr:extracellular solute-binding protein [Haloactinomyces albus]MDR7303811.1 arabinogalactan oligomer/maltooligosaccharide transport system substrate-binding protein [Haloactinomyces albus]